MNINPQALRILCFGDSNTWGHIPGKMGKERFSIDKRWTGLLQKKLGDTYEIIEEGLGGRTTVIDDPRPDFPERNGKVLRGILESHLPLKLVILMLGTTEAKSMMNRTPQEIAEGLTTLIGFIKIGKVLEATSAPKILIVVPPIVREEAAFASTLFQGGTSKTRQLGELYQQVADKENCFYLDPNSSIVVDKEEGIHLTEQGHQQLANLVYEKVKNILEK